MSGNVRTFLTHSNGKPLTYGVLLDQRESPVAFSKGKLRAFVEAANRHPGACAFGKLVVLRKDRILTFQSHHNGDVSRTFCGNSTAAALRIAGTNGTIRTKVQGNRWRSYAVDARIDDSRVEQRWTVPLETARVRPWHGCRALFLSTLNPYAFLLDPLPDDLTATAALRRLEATGLATKLALISESAGMPMIAFYNANGRHGAAPQTGVATLALAAKSVPMLRAHFPEGRFAYETAHGLRTAHLPAVAATPCGSLAIDMPEVSVSLEETGVEMAA